jgi:uncharacterized membrane protein YqjE
MTETPHAQRGHRPRALERRLRDSDGPAPADESVAGALGGLADGLVTLVQHRFELARHEATAAASTFGGLAVIAAVGLTVLAFGLAALHLALVLGAFALWGAGAAAIVALVLALVEAIAGGGCAWWAKGRIQEERQLRWAQKQEARTGP